MATILCKLCGCELSVEPGLSVKICQRCGNEQIVPSQDPKALDWETELNHRKRRSVFAWISVAVFLLGLLLCVTVVPAGVRYKKAEKLLEEDKPLAAAIAFWKVGKYWDARERSLALWNQYGHRDTVKAEFSTTSVLKNDGTAVTEGSPSFEKRENIISLGDYGYALRADGRIVDRSGNVVTNWENIVAFSNSTYQLAGLKADGTVVVNDTNSGCVVVTRLSVYDWEDIVSIDVSDYHIVGLKSDGTVLARGANRYGECDVSGWRDIVAISVGEEHTVGLKADGTVVATGNTDRGRCNVQFWEGIVDISAGSRFTVGLKADGTVVAVGNNTFGQCDVSEWENIVAISAGFNHTIGLKADGKVVAVGDPDNGRCEVESFKDVKLP